MTRGSLKVETQILGDFIQEFPPEHDSLELTFTPSSRPIQQRWRNNRLSAHFVADYLSSFLPLDEEDANSEKRIKEGKGAVSYIANELLENAIKFNHDAANYKVRFGLHFLGEIDVTVAIFATNSAKLEAVNKLKEFIKKLFSSDPNEFYLEQLERNAESDSETSGLGLLTMVNDYSAKIGWKFEPLPNNPEAIAVTTLVQIIV